MLNKSFIAFNVLHKINMLKPYTDIFKSQYTIWQRANFRSWYVFWLESLYPYQQIDTGISYCSGRSYCDLCRTHVINTELYPRWVFFSDHKSGSQFPSGSTKSCFGKSTLGSPARCRFADALWLFHPPTSKGLVGITDVWKAFHLRDERC